MAARSDRVAEVVQAMHDHQPPVTNLADARRAADSAKRTEAVSLRMAGLTYVQIGDRLGMTPQGAQRLVSNTLTQAENIAANEMRELEGARLDRAQAAVWTKVLEGDTKAIDTFLRISQRRARLFGLDAPVQLKVDLSVRAELDQALDDLQEIVLARVVTDDEADQWRDTPALPAAQHDGGPADAEGPADYA